MEMTLYNTGFLCPNNIELADSSKKAVCILIILSHKSRNTVWTYCNDLHPTYVTRFGKTTVGTSRLLKYPKFDEYLFLKSCAIMVKL